MTTSTARPSRARHEERYLASEDLGRLALRTAGSHLPLAREDSPYQWLTTTYCDTNDWSVYRGAEAGAAIRLRFREYHRTRPDAIFSSPRLWVELKEDVGDRWRKDRFEAASAEVPALLRGERRFPLGDEDLVKSAESLVARGARPVVVTQYNRLAYALPDDSMRVTADHNLIYLAVPWASQGDDAVPSRIGPLLGRERGVIIEVKWFDELPLWADELRQFLHQRAPTDRPSKFVVAMRHLLGADVR
jgi:hypothetical protein